MANRKISALTALTGASAAYTTDYIPVVDAGEADADKNKRITLSELNRGMFYGAMVRKSVDQTTANYASPGAVLTWDTEVYDIGGWHSTSSDTGRLTVPSTNIGFVQVGANVRCDLAIDEVVGILLQKNGSVVFDGAAHSIARSGNTSPCLSFNSGPITVTSTDYFDCLLFTGTDTSLSVIAARSNFWIKAVG